MDTQNDGLEFGKCAKLKKENNRSLDVVVCIRFHLQRRLITMGSKSPE